MNRNIVLPFHSLLTFAIRSDYQAPLEFLLQHLHRIPLLVHFEHDSKSVPVVELVFVAVYCQTCPLFENLDYNIQLHKELLFDNAMFGSIENTFYYQNLLQLCILVVSVNKKNMKINIFFMLTIKQLIQFTLSGRSSSAR